MGAPNSAITASPMYLSSVPPSFCTMSVIRVRYSRSLCTTTCGSCFSVKVVKSRMSEKSTVTVRRSPPHESQQQRQRDDGDGLCQLHPHRADDEAPVENVRGHVGVLLDAGVDG